MGRGGTRRGALPSVEDGCTHPKCPNFGMAFSAVMGKYADQPVEDGADMDDTCQILTGYVQESPDPDAV